MSDYRKLANDSKRDIQYGDLADRAMKLLELYIPELIKQNAELHRLHVRIDELRIKESEQNLKFREIEFNRKVETQTPTN